MSIALPKAPARKMVNREEFAALPEGPPYYELIDGELVMAPSPIAPHVRLLARLGARLDRYVESHSPAGWLFPEFDLYLPNTTDVYRPDLMYLSAEHLRRCQRNGIHGAPDLVCEVLSPSTERRDRRVKLEACRRAKVPHVWLIDPERPLTVEEYVLAPSGLYEMRTASAPEVWSPALFPDWSWDLGQAQAEMILPGEDEAPASDLGGEETQ